jgi:hypothetical protein
MYFQSGCHVAMVWLMCSSLVETENLFMMKNIFIDFAIHLQGNG